MNQLLKSTLITSTFILLTACGGGSSGSGGSGGTGGSGDTDGTFDIVATSTSCGGAIAKLILNGGDASGTGTTSADDPFDINGTRDISTGVITGGYVYNSVTNGQFATYTGVVDGDSVTGTYHHTLDNCDGTWTGTKN